MISSKLYLVLATIFIINLNILAEEFPGDLPGIEIGMNLPVGYEPSGLVWHKGINKLFVVSDGGEVDIMDSDGSNVSNIYSSFYDLEGICVADYSSEFAYIGVENPDGIIELNITTGSPTRFFDLTQWMIGPDNLGLEALTFIHDPSNAEGGYFYAGMQNDGKIYVFQLPIITSNTSTAVTYMETIVPVADRWDLSGLHYDEESRVLYGIWDVYNKLQAMNIDGSYIAEWDLPGNDQEGITVWAGNGSMQGKLFIAEDVGNEIWKYGFNSDITLPIEGNGIVNLTPETPGYYGTPLILSAIPDTGWIFSEWYGDFTGGNQTDTIIMNNDKEVTAVFLPDTNIYLSLKVFLEGPFNGSVMNADLLGLNDFPLSQPYNIPPWNYSGTESVNSIPNSEVVDWVLIELRDTTEASLATEETMIAQQAAFLLNDGQIVGLDGDRDNPCLISAPPLTSNLFVVIHHRNHLGIMGGFPATYVGNTYEYDFTFAGIQVYGGLDGHKEIGTNIWGMISGDTNSDGIVNLDDKALWMSQAGANDYDSGDFDMNGQINNSDKNELWIENNSKQAQVPD